MTAVATEFRASTAARPGHARPGAVLAVLLVGQFMAILDVSIVNVAAPTVRQDLHASGAGLQLVIAGYTISYAVLLITGARLGDRYGHGRTFRVGLALFTLASLACGLAPTTATLVVFRFVQGVGAAAMMPQVMSLIQRTFAGSARARALSLYSAVIACGAVVGQVLGGVLVSADLFGTGWRPVFAVNVPIGVLLLVLAKRWLPDAGGDPARRMDPAGVLALSAAVLLFVVPLVLGHEERWPAWCWAGLAASVAAVGVFVAVERAVLRRGGTPLISGRVMRAPGLVLGAAAMLVAMVNYGGFLFAFALHLQLGLGDGAAQAGLLFAPMAVGFAATGLTWRYLPAHLHGGIIPTGLAVAAAGYLLLAATLRAGDQVGAGTEVTLLVIGLALGAAFSPLLTVALSHVPVAHAADASGVFVTVFQLGQVLGVATLGTLYLSSVDGAPSLVPAHASGHAVAITFVALAASAVLAAACSLALVRPRGEVMAA